MTEDVDLESVEPMTGEERRAEREARALRLRREFPRFDWSCLATEERTITRMEEDQERAVIFARDHLIVDGPEIAAARCTECGRVIAELRVPCDVDLSTPERFKRFAFWETPLQPAWKRGKQYITNRHGEREILADVYYQKTCKQHSHRLPDPDEWPDDMVERQMKHKLFRTLCATGMIPYHEHGLYESGRLYVHMLTPVVR